MTLFAINLLIVATLATWLFRRQRLTALLLLSVITVYALQPAGAFELALPTATLLLTLGVWWLTNPAPTTDDVTLSISRMPGPPAGPS